jgi:hypothetical protein
MFYCLLPFWLKYETGFIPFFWNDTGEKISGALRKEKHAEQRLD